MSEIPEEQLDMLRHMLGINDPGMPWPQHSSRNFAAVDPSDTLLPEMEAAGLVRCYFRGGVFPGRDLDYYETTDDGRRAALASFKARQWSKSRRRYLTYLNAADVLPGLTFRDFLTRSEFEKTRKNC